MNISKNEQRVLHVLSQGGRIEYFRNQNGKVTEVTCFSREGYVLSDCNLSVFQRLLKRGFIRSENGSPYRISKRGRECVRPQFDNR